MTLLARIRKVFIALGGAIVALLLLPLRGGAPIILIGENKGRSAQDNGWIFYRWCREASPKLKIYFLSRKANPDLENIEDTNIVWFWSIRHVVLFFWATTLVFSHSLNDIMRGGKLWQHVFHWRRHLCLQHGVMGFKNVSEIYDRDVYRSDAFVVSSNVEARLCVNTYGYSIDELVCTGLPRFRNLPQKPHHTENTELLFMPTWRNWIHSSKEEFKYTNYFRCLERLICNSELVNLLEQYDAVLKVYLHINMQRYSNTLHSQSDRIRFLKQGEEEVQRLIRDSTALITDYSSVAWDLFYQRKPVIFYRFDIEEYMSKQGGLLDLREELFGPVVFDAESVVHQLGKLGTNNWRLEERFMANHNMLFRHHDNKQCERIFGVVKTLMSKKHQSHPTIASIMTPPPETWAVNA